MTVYEIKQEDIADLLALISAASLTITANNAARVTQLQVMLRAAQPSAAIDELKVRCEKLEAEVRACLRVRDAALLEAGLAKRRGDELEAMYGDQGVARRASRDQCNCGHPCSMHNETDGCTDPLCVCMSGTGEP